MEKATTLNDSRLGKSLMPKECNHGRLAANLKVDGWYMCPNCGGKIFASQKSQDEAEEKERLKEKSSS